MAKLPCTAAAPSRPSATTEAADTTTATTVAPAAPVLPDGGAHLTWLTEWLAVGGRYPSELTEWLAREQGVRAVVDLRDEACDDATELDRQGIDLLHLPTEDRCGVSLAMLDEGVAFVASHRARGQRVLIHCEHGIGRSATLALCVLVDAGLAPLAALELAKSRRSLVSPSPAQYEAWAAWLRARGVDAPEFEAFAAIAYRHLRREE
jgi:protein-tyrosine phosphatase